MGVGVEGRRGLHAPGVKISGSLLRIGESLAPATSASASSSPSSEASAAESASSSAEAAAHRWSTEASAEAAAEARSPSSSEASAKGGTAEASAEGSTAEAATGKGTAAKTTAGKPSWTPSAAEASHAPETRPALLGIDPLDGEHSRLDYIGIQIPKPDKSGYVRGARGSSIELLDQRLDVLEERLGTIQDEAVGAVIDTDRQGRGPLVLLIPLRQRSEGEDHGSCGLPASRTHR